MDTLEESGCPRRRHHLHRQILESKTSYNPSKHSSSFQFSPGGPKIVETHSYKLSPFGPALQFGGGSSVISASSFCMRFAEVPRAFDIFGFAFDSFVSGFGAESAELPAPLLRRPPPLEPAPLPAVVDIF